MPAKVNPALGTTLSYSTNLTAPSYTLLAQVMSVEGPNISVGEADTTNLTSTIKTSRYTLPDNGDVTFKLQFDPADTSHAELTSLAGTPAQIAWQIGLADAAATKVTFQGFLKELKASATGPEANLEADCTIRVNTAVTW